MLDELDGPAESGGLYVQRVVDRNQQRARRTLEREYAKAGAWVLANPVSDAQENTLELVAIRNQIADRPDLFSHGVAGFSERAVLRRLVEVGLEGSSVIVARSVRQLAEAADLRPNTVSDALKRLRSAGHFLRLYKGSTGGHSFVYLLSVATRERTTDTGGLVPPAPEEHSVSVVGGQVHRLFGPRGLPRAALETFARLPARERARRVSAGGGSPVRGGHRGAAHGARVSAKNPHHVHKAPSRRATATAVRTLPTAPVRLPPTASELSRETERCSSSTVMRHLLKMEQYEMVQQNADRTWERLRFDPDLLADSLGIEHTAELKAQQHRYDREQWAATRVERCEQGVAAGRLVRSEASGRVAYVSVATGAVIEEFAHDAMFRALALRADVRAAEPYRPVRAVRSKGA